MLSSNVNKLLDLIATTNCQLRSLGLVNANINETSINKIINLMGESTYIKELDLSWSKQTIATWRRFLLAIKDNRQLESLNLSYNKILDN